ncbi:PREDICTED: condensin complex subunit 2 [Chrysochloris asiatica]|uniref:Condensin complex subunit 2 n=1 Tax=Chrysochloris asiatica TaxID=185453 RepID=A0A9B0U4X8_CHRAS|nr:PREDICTED: condensin complex subunit 2 [Chrysochloris asiatica]
MPLPRKAPLSTPGTPILEDFPQNDDEKERLQRRRSRVLDLQFSTDSPHLLTSPSSRSIDSSATISKFTNTQITEHYSTCIKLSAENKITTKNAFGLHLIDFMSEILKEKDTELTNFKVAAGTLDASTKIYAVRVDAVHADVYRVLGGLGKDAPEEMESSGTGGSVTEMGTAKKAPKPKKKHLYKTIEQNVNNLNTPEADRKCEIDPMFQRTAASFDECSTTGVFLSTLHCHDYRSELLFPSDVQMLPTGEALELPDLGWVEMADLKAPLQQCVESRQICPSLDGFQFTKWDSETHNESVSALVDKFKKNDQVFDVNAEVEESDCGDFLDGPLEDDFDAHDEPDHTTVGNHDEFRSWQEPCQVQSCQEDDIIPLGDGDIRTMCPLLSMKPGEYSYFSPRTMSMWAGPDHWHFRPRHKKDASLQSENKKKSTKKDFEIDFEQDVNFDVNFRKTKAATILTKSTLENQNWRATTLPTDFHYEVNNLVQLHLKPGIKLLKMAQAQKTGTEQYEEIEDYDYNNLNDTSNFCPGLQAADSDYEESDDLFVGPAGAFDLTPYPCHSPKSKQENNDAPESQGLEITTYRESNLVAEPQKVNKIEIQYAKTAKKMDMKKLKQSMWGLLTKFSKKQADAEANHSEVEKREDLLEVADEKLFSGLTKDLKTSLPPLMAQNLSIPLAFACLLHLANEKNLKLEGTEDLSDVLVRQGD